MIGLIEFFILVNAIANINYAKQQAPKYQKINEILKAYELGNQEKIIELLEKLEKK